MQPRAHFTAVQQAPDDDHSSIEMLNMHPSTPQQKTSKSPNWMPMQRKSQFHQQWSSFPWRITLVMLSLPLALSPIVGLAAAAEVASQSYIRGRDCYANGLWKFSPGASWRIMDSSYFFTPNLAFGSMTFTQVKVIDIAWDLIVGRGGQLLLAWVNYRVFNEWLVYHMEHHVTSYKFYAALAFQTTTMGTLGVLGKEWLAVGPGKTTWRKVSRWLAMLSMVLSTLYVLSFPTLMGAMTGYIATSEPYVMDHDKNLIGFDKTESVLFVIEDAQRIGYEKPLVVGIRDSDLLNHTLEYIRGLNGTIYFDPPPDVLPPFQANKSSTWNFENNTRPLESPSLHITRYYNVKDWGQVPTSQAYFTFDGRQGRLYDTAYMLANSSCKPGERYQWGFSYIFLFMMSIFNFVWACVMAGMWFDTRRGSQMYKMGRRPGLLRCVLEYSAAIKEELGEGAEHLEEDELRRRLVESGGALVVSKHDLRVTRTNTGDFDQPGKAGWRRRLTKGSTF